MLNMDQTMQLIFSSYNRAKSFLNGYDWETRDLANMSLLFDVASIPRSFAPTITVTGSKGKGSTSLLCSAMLQGAGHKVGLILSPHLVDFLERIRINGHAISEADFTRIFTELEGTIRSVDANLPTKKYLSPTGLVVACAMRYFAEEQVTAMVIEAGRGGRFDDVNLLNNAVTCLTPILGEHLDKLGPTVLDIAWHKTGLIKPNSSVISAPQSSEVTDIIRKEAAANNAHLVCVGRDILFSQQSPDFGRQHITVTDVTKDVVLDFNLQTAGAYQGMNAAVAYGAVQQLVGIDLGQQASIARVLERLRFPGRCEQVSNDPIVFVDGAINKESATQFLNSVLPLIRRPLVLVTALPQDKDFSGLLEVLAPLADKLIVTQASNKHLYYTDEVVRVARVHALAVEDQPDVTQAFTDAIKDAGPQGMVWVVGTQSLVGDALRFWQRPLNSIWLD